MAKGYVCDMTGKSCEGESIRNMLVSISPRLSLMIVPQQKIDATHFGQGDLSRDGAELIEKALSVLKEKEPAKKG